ncbi:hypothetical protein B0H12DRAFT_1067178 [Mycena haematopus]|nr:hypothetical protein B0H12DRAFT_1067178 [Mycena haematopus]
MSATVEGDENGKYCDDCAQLVRFGKGGEANWDQHLKSEKHKHNTKAKKKSARRITDFFSLKPRPQPRAPAPSPPAPSVSTSHEPKSSSSIIDVDALEDYLTSSGSVLPVLDLRKTILNRLHTAISTLPSSIPFATSDDLISLFAVNPNDLSVFHGQRYFAVAVPLPHVAAAASGKSAANHHAAVVNSPMAPDMAMQSMSVDAMNNKMWFAIELESDGYSAAVSGKVQRQMRCSGTLRHFAAVKAAVCSGKLTICSGSNSVNSGNVALVVPPSSTSYMVQRCHLVYSTECINGVVSASGIRRRSCRLCSTKPGPFCAGIRHHCITVRVLMSRTFAVLTIFDVLTTRGAPTYFVALWEFAT